MGEGASTPQDTVSILVWVLRVVLPCVLFWISFGPKLRIPWPPPGRRHSRELMLEHRRAVLAASAAQAATNQDGIFVAGFANQGLGMPPPELQGMMVVTEETAPSLFPERRKQDATDADGSSGGGGKKSGVADSREAGGDPAERSGDRSERDGGRDHDRHRDRERRPSKDGRKKRPAAPPEPEPEAEAEADVEAKRGAGSAANEVRMHLESLVNFVAFNRNEQQRSFLHLEGFVPPPPPTALRKPTANAVASSSSQAIPLACAAAERANAEARMVLHGALRMAKKRPSVARCLYAQLIDLGVDITLTTFELMVELCLQGNDVSAASDFLLRIEHRGMSPNHHLLDRVVEMLFEQKKRAAEKPKPPPEPTPPAAEVAVTPAAQALAPEAGPALSYAAAPPVPPPPPMQPAPLLTMPVGQPGAPMVCGAAWQPAVPPPSAPACLVTSMQAPPPPPPLPPSVVLPDPMVMQLTSAIDCPPYHQAYGPPPVPAPAPVHPMMCNGQLHQPMQHGMMSAVSRPPRPSPKEGPAFSVPHEFATEKAAAAEQAAEESKFSLSADAAMFVPGAPATGPPKREPVGLPLSLVSEIPLGGANLTASPDDYCPIDMGYLPPTPFSFELPSDRARAPQCHTAGPTYEPQACQSLIAPRSQHPRDVVCAGGGSDGSMPERSEVRGGYVSLMDASRHLDAGVGDDVERRGQRGRHASKRRTPPKKEASLPRGESNHEREARLQPAAVGRRAATSRMVVKKNWVPRM